MTSEITDLKTELEQEKTINNSLNMQKKAKTTMSTNTTDLEEDISTEREQLETNFIKLNYQHVFEQ